MIDLGDCREQQHLRELEAEMTSRGWLRTVNFIGDLSYIHPSGDWEVELSDEGYWALRKFTDADVETDYGLVAQGRYRTHVEGESLEELRDALNSSTGIERTK